MPAFGFSVGDFIAAIELCNKIAKALKDTDGASSDFIDVAIELHGLENVLRRVLALEPNTSNIAHVNAIRSLALSCQIPLQKFLEKLQGYESALGPVSTRKFQAGRKLMWAFQMVDEVNKMRGVIAAKTASINMSLAMHSSEALSRLEARSSKHHDDVLVKFGSQQQDLEQLSDKMDRTRDKLMNHVSTATTSVQKELEDVARESSDTRLGVVSLTAAFASSQASFTDFKDVCLEMLVLLQRLPTDLLTMIQDIQQSIVHMHTLLQSMATSVPASPTLLLSSNIQFEDALGTPWSLQYEYFKHWEMFQCMLSCKFKDRPGERNVRSGRFLILNLRVPGEIISEDNWDLIVQPGAHLYMSIGLVRSYSKSTSCPRPGCTGVAVPVQSQLLNEGSTMICEQCGVQSMYIPSSLSELSAIDALISLSNQFKSKENNQHRDTDQDSACERSPGQKSRVAQQNIATLAAATKGIVCFRRLIARLRNLEEREFKAFKTVHMKTPRPTLADFTSAGIPNNHPGFDSLLRTLQFLHGIQIRHKDIMPSNILIKGDVPYITDFGASVDFAECR